MAFPAGQTHRLSFHPRATRPCITPTNKTPDSGEWVASQIRTLLLTAGSLGEAKPICKPVGGLSTSESVLVLSWADQRKNRRRWTFRTSRLVHSNGTAVWL